MSGEPIVVMRTLYYASIDGDMYGPFSDEDEMFNDPKVVHAYHEVAYEMTSVSIRLPVGITPEVEVLKWGAP